jgi:hypothetical protein
MKAVIFALAVAAVAAAAAAAPISAQVPSRGIPSTSTSRNTSIDGSWRVVGQDRSGTIYERRTYDANGNIVVQRARRDANGNFTILNSRTVQTNGNRNDCQTGSTNTVGDIVFGRNGANNCQYNGQSNRRAADGVWRQVGRGRSNNSIYERRTIDANGNVVVQRGRRNSNGSFTILSTRTAGNHGRASRSGNVNNGSWNRGHGDDDDDNNSQWDNRRGDNDDRSGNSERNDHGRGKGKKGRD